MQKKIDSLLKKVFIGTANFKSHYGLAKNVENIDLLLNQIYTAGIKRLDMSNRYIFEINDLNKSKLDWLIQYKVQIDNNQPVYSFEEELQILFSKVNNKMVNRILIHNADQIIENYGVKMLDKLYRSIPPTIKFGVSLYETSNLNLVSSVDFVEIIQFPANVLDRRIEVMKSERILSQNLSNKVLQARSIFLQGLLLDHFTDFPTNLIPYKKILDDWVNWNILNRLKMLESNLSEVLIHQKLDEIVFGINSIEHLREFISSGIDAPRFNYSYEIPSELIDPRTWHR